MSSTAGSDARSPLVELPLEIRHNIFNHVADARNVKPRYTLRYWFEKVDIQEQIAEKLKDDPDANVTYVAGYNHRHDNEQPEVDDGAVVDQDNEDEEDEDQADDDDEHEVEEEDGDEEDDQDGDIDGDAVDEDEEMSAEEDAVDDEHAAVPNVVQDGGNTTATANVTHDDVNTTTTNNAQAAVDNTGAETNQIPENREDAADVEMTDHEDEREDTQEDVDAEQVGAHGADMAEDGGKDDSAAAVATDPPKPEVIVVKPNHKWRHVSQFMHLTQCPPQANLFLISKQLNIEAKEWFYDVATLKIDATASFLHFSFFELALNKLAEAPFSPMESIKKAEVTFVWDTTWIRSEPSGFAGAVFPVFLKSRADFILEILLRAPELEKVKIIWHDSAEDDGAKQVRADTLEPFIVNLKAKIETEDHYIAPDAKPRAKSRAGKQRLEFKAIIDNGCETF